MECQTNTSCLVSCLLVTYPGGPNYWKVTCDDLFVGLHKNVKGWHIEHITLDVYHEGWKGLLQHSKY